jgi:hypothetical protein
MEFVSIVNIGVVKTGKRQGEKKKERKRTRPVLPSASTALDLPFSPES